MTQTNFNIKTYRLDTDMKLNKTGGFFTTKSIAK